MKDVISVDEILPCISCGVDGDVADGFGTCTCGNEAKRKLLHSLLISKLPEKDYMCRNSPDYKRAVEDMRKSIDELFGVQNG